MIAKLKAGASARMPDELKKAVNEAFDGAEEAEDKEVEACVNDDVKTARQMINEIEEELEELDEKELTAPNQTYVNDLIMSLSRFIKHEEEGETDEKPY